jgi:hypothetical protein
MALRERISIPKTIGVPKVARIYVLSNDVEPIIAMWEIDGI